MGADFRRQIREQEMLIELHKKQRETVSLEQMIQDLNKRWPDDHKK